MAKYCANCGKELDEDSMFCWSCGQAVNKEKTDIVDGEEKHLLEEKGLKEDPKVVKGEGLRKDKFHLEGKNKKILIGIASCLLVITLVFVFLFNMGAFLSDADKVLMALENTMMESRLVQDLSCARVILEDKYTVETDGRVGEERIKTVHIRDGAERYVSMEYDDVDYKMHLKKDELMFWDYRLEDKILMYQYRQEQGEELRDVVGEENIDAFNILLKKLYDENIDKSIMQKSNDIILEKIRSMEFSTKNTKKFVVGNEKKECVGYAVEISESDIMDVIRKLRDMYETEFSDIYAAENAIVDNLADWDEIEKTWEEKVEELEGEIIFFLYKDLLVGLELETEKQYVEIAFGGDESILEEVEIVYEKVGEGVTEYSISGNVRNEKESYKIKKNHVDYAKLTYDLKEGLLELDCIESNVYLDVVLEGSKEGLVADIETFMVGEEEGFRGTISIMKKSVIEDLEGEETYDEDDFITLINEETKPGDIQMANTIATAVYTAISNEDCYEDCWEWESDWNDKPTQIREGYLGGGLFEENVLAQLKECDYTKTKTRKTSWDASNESLRGVEVDVDSGYWLSLDLSNNCVRIYVKTNVEEVTAEAADGSDLEGFVQIYPFADDCMR